MTRTNTALLVVLIAAVVLVGGGIIYSLNRADRGTGDTSDQTSQTSESSNQNSQADTSLDERSDESAESDSQVIDGVDIPGSVLAQIERDYPDYIIDDADREVRGGEVHYEIELEHRTPGNESEYELTYNESWELIDTKFESS